MAMARFWTGENGSLALAVLPRLEAGPFPLRDDKKPRYSRGVGSFEK
ncbi:hypothetical protein TGS27_2896 [Geobacillus stearothermophilus]|uniref:Uncharacterized protein n=1 Tax=Geobacillus stearothermophilus TaxID=1422 RepID=A0A150N5J0_GEOSE|nr:hypothetical protein B4109_0163 [Geobacillus stearothermophilus]KYD31934.1 hypothetical protein B4114_0156 [Geobacillus stearothermophilus]OAO76938.1 hypothetical protein TGS27_2896 [Geobacillus stearothermophilus]